MNINNSAKRSTFSAIAYSFGGNFSNTIVSFILGIILARLLFPEDYGLLGMMTIFIAISQLFIDGGMTNALIREKDASESDYSTVFYYNLSVSIIVYIVLYLLSDAISSFYNEPVLSLMLKILGLNVIIGSFGLIQRTILIKELNFRTQMIVDVLATLVSGLVAVALAYKGAGVWSLIVQQLSRQLLTSVLFMLHNKWKPLIEFNYNSFKRLFGFGWKLLLTGLFATAYNNIFNVIIGKAYPSYELGYYTKSLQTRDLAANSITASIERVSYPLLSSLQDEPERLSANFKKIIKHSSFITFPIMIGLAVTARPLINLIYGENWLPMVPYFQILCLGGITYPHRAINLNVLKVVGRSDLFLKLDIIKIVIGVVVISSIVFFQLGIYALLWSTVLLSLSAYIINSVYSKKFINYSLLAQTVDMIPVVIASLVMGVSVYAFGFLPNMHIVLTLIVQFIMGIVIYSGMCKLIKIEEFNFYWDIIVKMIERKL